MSLADQIDQKFPRHQINHIHPDVGITFAVILSIGLFIIIPITNHIFGISPLFVVPVVGLIYGALVLLARRLVVGTVVATIVTSTFAANVPLASTEYLAEMPGQLGPDIWFVYLPLAAAVVLLLPERQKWRQSLDLEQYLFGGFVIWTVIVAWAANPVRVDVALYFSLFMLVGFIIYSIVKYVVKMRKVPFKSVVATLLITVGGHLCYGLIQLANQRTLQLTELGEPGNARVISTIQVGSLGSFDIGIFVTGFTGMAFNLAALLILVFGVPLAYYWNSNNSKLILLYPVAAALAVRTTSSDAARGAFLITVLLLVAALSSGRFLRINRMTPRNTSAVIGTLLAAVASVLAILIPSTQSGATSTDGSGEGTGGGTAMDIEVLQGITDSLSIPLVDLSNLSIRIYQYAVGVDIFVKNPIFGIGGGNFKFVASSYDPVLSLPLHNIYLAVLVETGILGFILYFGAITVILWKGYQIAKNGKNKIPVVALLCGIIGLFAFGMWDIHIIIKLTVFLPFWVTLGAIAGDYHGLNLPEPEIE